MAFNIPRVGVLLLACLVCSVCNSSSSGTNRRQPNIVVLVADDWGFTDVGAFGSEIATPNLDALAHRGAKFSNFHVAATCSPTRAMLLTGVDSHRNGVGNMPETTPASQEGKPGYGGVLNNNVVTLATMLRDKGYHTYIAGKWHLGKNPGELPGSRGFEKSFIQADSGSDNWENRTYMLLYDKAYWFEQDQEASPPKDFYSSQFFVDKTLDYLAADAKDAKPFFAYIGFQANHIPLQAPREFIDKYRGKYADGWTALRQARRDRAAALGLVPSGTTLADLRSTQDWGQLSPAQQREQAQHMEVYAGMAQAMDFHVGRLVAHLKASGQYENTVFVFLSDNGSDPANPLKIALSKAWLTMNYVTHGEGLGAKGTFSANGPSWASATNSPFSGYKYFASEGGLRVPLIIAGLPGMAQGQTTGALTHVNDLVPTLLDAAGVAPHGGTYQGKPVERTTGHSLLPLLMGRTDRVYGPEEPLGYELAGSAALFKGDYKLVKNIAPLGDGQWHLYDLSVDPGETRDLKDIQLERFNRMSEDYAKYAQDNGVLPVPEGFELESTAHRYAFWHYAVPKMKTALPWILLALALVVTGFVGLRRRTRALVP